MSAMNQSRQLQAIEWGRRKHANGSSGLKALAMMTVCPILTIQLALTMDGRNGSLHSLFDLAPLQSCWRNLDSNKLSLMHKVIAGYLLFQILLYRFCPGGYHTGQHTPGGHLLEYKTNGVAAFFLTYACFWLGHATDLWEASWIAANFSTFVVASNMWGLVLTLAVYAKGRFAPMNLEDRVLTGSSFYDLFMGIELNPRLPGIGDLKMFAIGRTGMMIWPLVLTSFAMLQRKNQGSVSTAMLVGVGLQFEYVVDFFWNEHWYLRTIDIAHDHVGFYMVWGCLAWLPTTYTLHVQFIARNSLYVGDDAAIMLLVIGSLGYILFRVSNNQKYHVRNSKGRQQVWGRPATFIEAQYSTADGVKHKAILLTCGWWGLARHINYVGDLVLSYATCATAGTSHLLPWFYAIYMTILLFHRCLRDEARCAKKYGADWQRYCDQVKWRLIPYVI